MPKHAVNTTEQKRIRKLFLAGNSAEAIAAHMNVDLAVVQAWHPDAVMAKKKELRDVEAELEAKAAETETAELEDQAAAAKRSEAGKKAAATRKANRLKQKDAAKDKDAAFAEERDRAQQQAAEIGAQE